ncbi:MAG TPA: hypothetical protein VIT23_09805 [Terrimicrobiaceae bacterium]
MSRVVSFALWAAFATQGLLIAGGWERLERCEFYAGAHSDGDSVEVRRNGKHYVFRLYFVDSLEKNPASSARRALQAEYFGMKDVNGNAPLRAAYQAASFTRESLREPFTVYTRWQPVDPESGNPAIRAFVETADGRDLSMLLVREGLAIIRHGNKAVSDHPDGRSRSDFGFELRKAEDEAKQRKRGAWGLATSHEDDLPLETLGASQHSTLVLNAGRKVKVYGRVSSVRTLPDGRLTFINFGSGKESKAFAAIIRGAVRGRFVKRFPEGLHKALAGRQVFLDGVITLFRNRPQMELESPDQIRLEPLSQGAVELPGGGNFVTPGKGHVSPSAFATLALKKFLPGAM